MKKYEIWIGTYTDGTDSGGIYRVEMDENGAFSAGLCIENHENPSYLCFSGDGNTLYAACELPQTAKIAAYDIRAEKAAELWNFSMEGGGSLCQLSLSEKHSVLLGACYDGGESITVRLPRDGNLPEPETRVKEESSLVCPHPHWFVPDKQEKYAARVDLGLDRVTTVEIAGGKTVSEVRFPAAEGPRCLVFHPRRDAAYLITEYSSRIYRFSYEPGSGTLTECGSVSSLPEGFEGNSYGSAIAISASGKTLYAGNRGADTVALFRIAEDGSLGKMADYGCGGRWPRHLSLTSDGKYLLVSNQHSGNVSVFEIDPHSGALIRQAASIAVPAPGFACEIPR